MLANPNAMDLMPKVGSRYEVALAVSKRARQISDKRVETGDPDITDPVDVASKELFDEKVAVIKDQTIQDAVNQIIEKESDKE